MFFIPDQSLITSFNDDFIGKYVNVYFYSFVSFLF